MNYPRIKNKEDLNMFLKKYLTTKKVFINNGWDTYRALKIKSPETRKDFAKMTKNLYGRRLHFYGNFNPETLKGWYEIVEDFYPCANNKIALLWEEKLGDEFRGIEIILNTVFGILTCGGTARNSYGSYIARSEDKERLIKLYNDR